MTREPTGRPDSRYASTTMLRIRCWRSLSTQAILGSGLPATHPTLAPSPQPPLRRWKPLVPHGLPNRPLDHAKRALAGSGPRSVDRELGLGVADDLVLALGGDRLGDDPAVVRLLDGRGDDDLLLGEAHSPELDREALERP